MGSARRVRGLACAPDSVVVVVTGGHRRLARRQQAARGRSLPGPAPADATWTTARLVAANLALLCGLAAVLVLVAGVITHLAQQVFIVVFVLLTVFLIRRGSRLRRRGLERIGRSVTAWAGVTGALVLVSGALSLEFTQFVPELLAVTAGWLLVLGIWKDLTALVTAAVVLVGPIVWGAFLWNRSLVGAVLIVVAAGAYARSGTVHRGLFGALVVAGVVVTAAAVHQLTHPAGANAFDGADLLALLIVLTCLVAAAEVESWRADWSAYAPVVRVVSVVRVVTAASAASAVALAAVAAVPGRGASWVAATPATAPARVVIAGIGCSRRPVGAGPRRWSPQPRVPRGPRWSATGWRPAQSG